MGLQTRPYDAMVLSAIFLTTLLTLSQPAAAQAPWEYAPYKIEAWVSFGAAPEFTPRFEADARLEMEKLAELEVGAPWTFLAVSPPANGKSELMAWLELASNLKLKTVARPAEGAAPTLPRLREYKPADD